MAALAEALADMSVLLATAALGFRPRRAQRLRAALRLLVGEAEARPPEGERGTRRRAVLPAALTARVEAAGLDWSDEAVILALMAGLAAGYVAGQLLVGRGVLTWLITAAGSLLPFVYWGHRAELRRCEMQREASEAVRALSRAVYSGLPLHEALRRFAQRSPGLRWTSRCASSGRDKWSSRTAKSERRGRWRATCPRRHGRKPSWR